MMNTIRGKISSTGFGLEIVGKSIRISSQNVWLTPAIGFWDLDHIQNGKWATLSPIS